MADGNRWRLHCQPGCLHGNVNWVSPADRTADPLSAPAASARPRLPSSGPFLTPPTPHSLCYLGLKHIFRIFVWLLPSPHFAAASAGMRLHSLPSAPAHHLRNGAHQAAVEMFFFSSFLPPALPHLPPRLSHCSQVKFTKLKWPVCFSGVGAAALTDSSGKRLDLRGVVEKHINLWYDFHFLPSDAN